MQIAVLVGTIASGKGVVSGVLQDNGWSIFVFSDLIGEEVKQRKEELDALHLSTKRDTYTYVGNELRKRHGDAYLAEMLFKKATDEGKDTCVFDGARNEGELDFLSGLRKQGISVTVIGVDAPVEVRERLWVARRRDIDKRVGDLTDEELQKQFHAMDDQDRGIGQGEHGQQVAKCLEGADFIIQNPGSIEGMTSEASLELFRKHIKWELMTRGVEHIEGYSVSKEIR